MALQIAGLAFTAALLVTPVLAYCQANAAAATHIETESELSARLTPTQRQQFDAAKKAQLGTQFQVALADFKVLLEEVPGDSLLTKWASDAAFEVGDSAYALELLRPLVQMNFEDWQAVTMLARAAAESGDKQARDAAMMNMAMLRQHGLTLTQYVVERFKVGEDMMTIVCFLAPSGPYKAYYIGRVSDAKGVIFLRIALESSDADQALVAKEHPREASAGLR